MGQTLSILNPRAPDAPAARFPDTEAGSIDWDALLSATTTRDGEMPLLCDPSAGAWRALRDATAPGFQHTSVDGGALSSAAAAELINVCSLRHPLPALPLPNHTTSGPLVARADAHGAAPNGALTVIFPTAGERPPAVDLATIEQFKAQLSAATSDVLRHVDWASCCAAGGLVEACLRPAPIEATTPELLRRHFAAGPNKCSDVDLFVVGAATPAAAVAKARQLAGAVLRALREDGAAGATLRRRPSNLTIVAPGYRDVQIITSFAGGILRFSSTSDLLASFDLDSACVAFDGRAVWASWRAARALCFGANVADLAFHRRGSDSYETRLLKYAARGYAVAVPGLGPGAASPGARAGGLGGARRARFLPRLLGMERVLRAGGTHEAALRAFPAQQSPEFRSAGCEKLAPTDGYDAAGPRGAAWSPDSYGGGLLPEVTVVFDLACDEAAEASLDRVLGAEVCASMAASVATAAALGRPCMQHDIYTGDTAPAAATNWRDWVAGVAA